MPSHRGSPTKVLIFIPTKTMHQSKIAKDLSKTYPVSGIKLL